jgi:hypothetical protein
MLMRRCEENIVDNIVSFAIIVNCQRNILPMQNNNFMLYKCVQCGDDYMMMQQPFTVSPFAKGHGFCSNDCITSYARRYDIHPKTICGKNIKQLKEDGHHELADWIADGGLEVLLSSEEDDDKS